MWREFSTAPRDGSKFDAWCVHPESQTVGVRLTDVQMRGDNSGFGFVVHSRNGVEWQYLDARYADSVFPEWVPTHWMPRPEGPNNKGD